MNSFGNMYARYGAIGTVRLVRDRLFTWFIFPHARLVRWPCYVRGKRAIQIGRGFTTGPGLRLDAFPSTAAENPILRIGTDVQLNDYVHIAAIKSVSIGDRVLIASKVFISDHNHGRYEGETQDSPLTPPLARPEAWREVVIEDDVWLGEGVAVLPGVRIGKGSVIGAMSVVTRDVPDYCIAVGSPARVMKRYSFETCRWEKV